MKNIYINGYVYTGALPLVEAFVEEVGLFVYAGSTSKTLEMKNNEDKVIDLNQSFVCSGFNDSHMHLLGLGKMLSEAMLSKHTNSLKDMIDYLKEYSVNNKSEWIIGRGWNQDYFNDIKRMPNRYDLDEISADKPVCIIRACGHALVVNSKALELLGNDVIRIQIDGGKIGIENNELDGRFYDNAMELVYALMPSPTIDELKIMILKACECLNAYGITSVQSDDYCSYTNLSWELIHEAYNQVIDENKLTVRVYEQANLTNIDDLKNFIEKGHVTGKGNEYFKIGPLKMLGDGALGSRTAYLSKPYEDDPTTKGLAVFSQSVFDEMIEYAHMNHMQCAIHSIGDACLDCVLNAYEKALLKNPKADHRHGIVHCQITREDQLAKIADLNLHVYAQSIFLDYDINIVEKRVGKQLADTSYRWKTLMNHNVSVSNSSDCPVEMPDVMAGIQCAVTRKTLDGTKSYHLDECFSIQEALDSYTKYAAYSSFEEHIKGEIKEGMYADFVVLEDNPFTYDRHKLKDIKIDAVYLNGQCVYN